MRECAGFGRPLVSSLPRPCTYAVTEQVLLNGLNWDVCYWHGKVFSGLITDAGGRPLSWTPKVDAGGITEEGENLIGFLRREWDLEQMIPELEAELS